ncbi:MAG: hypothetical protein ISS76_19910 [Phycisphaerae bacterium]|nr:hypothetical protein [Phycisphaerae bacterium]
MEASCNSCHNSFVIPEVYIGKSVKCPNCKQEVLIDSTTCESQTLSSNTNKAYVFCMGLTISFLVTSILWFIPYYKVISQNGTIKNQLKAAEEQAEKAKVFMAVQNKNLNNLYPTLKKFFWNREIAVREGYVKSIYVAGQRIRITLHNSSYEPVKPDLTIWFLNAAGFPVANENVQWLMNTIKPGETRVEESTFSKRDFGEIEYFYVEYR